ncbi:hypothetical protein [Mucilaginibacter terrae]|uniref:Uncharacterized protein n=1 Tax=Mucilaginibacter terrae TaxID=1955052 RepID=A0ABU3GNE4_9SPHI|nr:hypothetical protein [Mucilaginibacter terrae]MDT3401297.1 hypothetical protein [Mucilaginibacter terrae]
MNELLTRLGVPPALQAWFNCEQHTTFDYGGATEIFAAGFHKVPTTPNVWLAGNRSASEVVITHSAMEAIAYLSIHLDHYPDLDRVAFIATGNLPSAGQLQWIRSNFKRRKFTLVFGSDLLGTVTDIKVAAALKGRSAKLFLKDDSILCQTNGLSHNIPFSNLSLHVFEKDFGLRTGNRTRKPKHFLSFLDQLQSDRLDTLI